MFDCNCLKTILFALAIFDLSLGDETQGNLLHRVRRIVGGRPTHITAAPYMVNIRKYGRFQCGGVLLTPRCILTAAHCVREGKPKDFAIRAGVTYLDQLQRPQYVDDIFIPSEYNKRTFDYDVAVFKLDGPMQGPNGITTIALSPTESLEPGEVIQVYGWGLTHESATAPSNQLRAVHLRVLEPQKCSMLYEGFRNVTARMFCASASGRRDACAADSGGPAVVDGRLVGIVSWGRRTECGRAQSPGVYTKVAEVRTWIEQTLDDHCH